MKPILIFCIYGSLGSLAVSAAPKAFPEAEGFGAQASGGRGGRVIYVTNLKASGPGSFQWALDRPGRRYVLFKVSGFINSVIHLNRGDVTIAGQTSPGGITVRGFKTDETPFLEEIAAPKQFAENWILRFLRARPGVGNGSDGDGLRLRYTRNAIVDHVSTGNATDEAIEISYSSNITVQNSLLAETLGEHSIYGGMLINYTNPKNGFPLNRLSIHHNVWNRIGGRFPEVSRESADAGGTTMSIEISCNLFWDPDAVIILGINTGQLEPQRPLYYKLNAVNNLYHARPSFPYSMFDDGILRDKATARENDIFIDGNSLNLYPARTGFELFYCCNDYKQGGLAPNPIRSQLLSVRNGFPKINYTATEKLTNYALKNVGCFPRDPMDMRLFKSLKDNEIASAPRNTNPNKDIWNLPAGPTPKAPKDTDLDGMPDDWEVAHGLNPTHYTPNSQSLSTAGYTNLEVYLNELANSKRP